MTGGFAIVVTCEHASAAVPRSLERALAIPPSVLRSHRGWDPGALPFSRALAKRLRAPLLHGDLSRLVVDLNRSPENPRRFSPWARALPAETRRSLDREVHAPHLARVLKACRAAGARGRTVVHVAVHSFDPTLAADRAGVDVGLLYDPARPLERSIAATWCRVLADAGLHARRNFPYRGSSDGLATWLRRQLDPTRYVGLELELSQAWSVDGGARRLLGPLVIDALSDALAGFGAPPRR